MGYSRTTSRADLARGIETEPTNQGAVAKAVLESLVEGSSIAKDDHEPRTVRIGNFDSESIGTKIAKNVIDVVAMPFRVHMAMKHIEHNIKAELKTFLGLNEATPVSDILDMRLPPDIRAEIEQKIESGALNEFQTATVIKKYDFENSDIGKAYLDIKMPDGSSFTVQYNSKIDRNFDRAFKNFDIKSDNFNNAVSKLDSAEFKMNEISRTMPAGEGLSNLIKDTISGALSKEEVLQIRDTLRQEVNPDKLTRQVVSACTDYVYAKGNFEKASQEKETARDNLNVARQEKEKLGQYIREAFNMK